MKIKMPAQAAKVIQTLEQHGFEAYIVGGCVRDSILGRTPGDWDITTSASPQEVKEIFDHTVDTGIEHGTVTVLMNHEPYEVTTYRIDGKYEDHRRPNEVHFTKSFHCHFQAFLTLQAYFFLHTYSYYISVSYKYRDSYMSP